LGTALSNSIIFFHQLETEDGVLNLDQSTSLMIWLPYFATKTSFQSALPGRRRRQRHFAKRLTLNNLTSRTPRPPLSFSLHTSAHFTQLIFFPPSHLPKETLFGFSPLSSTLYSAFLRKKGEKLGLHLTPN
jgi:hypothetical protein